MSEFDYEATVKEVRKMQQSNMDKLKSLATYGKALDPAAFANNKIDVFVQMFLDPNAQAAYALAVETSLAESLKESLAQVRQEQLLQGVNQSGLTIPKR